MGDLFVCTVCGKKADELVHSDGSAQLSDGPALQVCNGTKRDITYIHISNREKDDEIRNIIKRMESGDEIKAYDAYDCQKLWAKELREAIE